MKRSEMVSVLENTLNGIISKNLIDKEGTYAIAEKLLSVIEEQNMLPPAYIPRGNKSIGDSVCEWEEDKRTCRKGVPMKGCRERYRLGNFY